MGFATAAGASALASSYQVVAIEARCRGNGGWIVGVSDNDGVSVEVDSGGERVCARRKIHDSRLPRKPHVVTLTIWAVGIESVDESLGITRVYSDVYGICEVWSAGTREVRYKSTNGATGMVKIREEPR